MRWMAIALALTLSLPLLLGGALADDGPEGPGVAAIDEVEPNDSLSTAQSIPLNSDVAATARKRGEYDRFRIVIDAPEFIHVTVEGGPGMDFTVQITDADNQTVAVTNGRGIGEGEDFHQRLRNGEHTLTVISRPARGDEAPEADVPYRLKLRRVTLVQFEPPIEDIKAAIRRGLAYLASQQAEDGGWESGTAPFGIAGLALMGFVAEGLPEHEETIRRAVEYLKTGWVPPEKYEGNDRGKAHWGGSLAQDKGNQFMYQHAIVLLALAEYVREHPDPDLRERIEAAVDLILRSQNTTKKPALLGGPIAEKEEDFGGWRYSAGDIRSDISVSGWCIIALAGAKAAGFGVPDSVYRDFMVYCRRCFREDRSAYCYQPRTRTATNTTNAIGVLTTLMCVGGECPVVRRGLRRIRYSMPRWEEEGGNGNYPFYYWYYGTRAMYVAGGEYWKEWQAVTCPMLLDFQNEDGSWNAEQHEKRVGIEYTTALAVLILQLMSGNPPAYLEGLSLAPDSYPCPKLVDDIEALIKAASRDGRSKDDLIDQIAGLIDRYRGD